MSNTGTSRLPEILAKYEADLLADWVREQVAAVGSDRGKLNEMELRDQGREFMARLREAAQGGQLDSIQTSRWDGVREILANLSRSRGLQGFTPAETASFVFSLKKPLFERLSREFAKDAEALADETWAATELLDQLGPLHDRDPSEVPRGSDQRQQQEMLELSTPVVKLWDGILALPMIGTLDSARTQIVMESLLQQIVETGSGIAIIDITGVPTVDTLTAQHLLEDRDGRPADGRRVHHQRHPPPDRADHRPPGRRSRGRSSTKATLADAFAVALQRTGRPSSDHAGPSAVLRGRLARGTHSDSPDGRVPAGHDPGRHARPPRDDAAGRSHQPDRQTGARGVLIDISSLDMVDSFIGRMIGNIASMSRILDAETVVVGMQPAVAITLVEFGLSLAGVRTALDVEKGMDLLRAAIRRRPAEGVDDRVEE